MVTVDPGRYITYRKKSHLKGPVVYWMSRDQRIEDNWALLFARQIARELRTPLAVVFTLAPGFLGACLRQYDFMLGGLEETESGLVSRGIPFILLRGEPPAEFLRFLKMFRVGTVVSDFDPLRVKRQWKQEVLENSDVNFFTVDAHNVVPVHRASSKQEFGAYTLRPKIRKLLPGFLVPFPELGLVPPDMHFRYRMVDWDCIRTELEADRSVGPVEGIKPGEKAAGERMKEFVEKGLESYSALKNDPVPDATSGLSAYLHFGQISSQRIALEILKERPGDENTESFLEELIIRKELSDNYCLYNSSYDSLENIPAWARKTHEEHRRDEREFIYTTEQFESGETHDPLWNAAQKQMTGEGRMHGYMRMYWAKKILEWTASPARAMEIAVYLNDRYQLDGRDPNGYTGCAWSIAGVHDRAWAERPVFGKIRYMNDRGCRRKFDVDAYIRKWG